MDQDLNETLETLQRQIDNLRDSLHGRIDRLEESVSHLDKVAARNPSVEAALPALLSSIMRAEKGINARLDEIEALMEDHSVSIHGLSEDVDALEARLASKPDDFGGVTSTGAPRYVVVPKTQWAITRKNGYIFCAEYGFAVRSWAAGGRATFFRSEMEASLVRAALFPRGTHADIEEVEVIERDGRLIEARYA